MIITIAGPAASGKGTLAKMFADALSLPHYDFGLLFRALAYANLEIQHLNVQDGRIIFSDKDITDQLRTEEIGLLAANMASQLKDLAMSLVRHVNFVCDGRTCGSEIYPNADFKFYITASAQDRINRRSLQHGNKQAFLLREKIDQERLVLPKDAVVVDTTGKSISECLEEMISYEKHFTFVRE